MADIKEAIRRLIYQYVVEGADKVMATQEAVAASTTKTDKASLSLEKTFNSLERRYVDTVRAQQDYAKVQEKVNAAVAQNPALQERANAVIDAAREKLNQATSQGATFSEVLSKGLNKIIGPGALVHLGMTAIGVAIGYATAQWEASRTTVEQALTEQNRLLAEAKKLLDEKTSAQERATAQSQDQTQFEVLQNELDLRLKLNKAMENAAALAERLAVSSAGSGQDPTGTGTAVQDPGIDKITEAYNRLKEAQAAGIPGLQAYNTELAKIGLANPALAEMVNQMIKANAAGIQLEQAAMKARAISDALAGVATNAQLAAVGLGSIAQFNFNNLRAQEAAAGLERMALNAQRLAQIYPGITSDVARQLELLDAQIGVAQARNQQEEMIAQLILKQAQYRAQGLKEDEIALLLAKDRVLAEENIKKASEKQVAVQSDVTEEVGRTAKAQYNVGIAIQNNNGWIQQHNNLLASAQQQAAALANEYSRIPGIFVEVIDHLTDMEVILHNMPQIKMWTDPNTGQKTQFNPEGYESLTVFGGLMADIAAANKKLYGEGNYDVKTDYLGGITVTTVQPTEDYIKKQLAPPTPLEKTGYAKKLEDALKNLNKSTDSLNETMKNALSPFYSQDPRTTKLGFRAGTVGNQDWMTGATNANPLVAVLGAGATAPGMAGGGSFVVGGGHSANDNRMAVFPVASGEEVVVNRNPQGRGSQVVNIDNRIIVTGSVDADALSKMKVSRYQQAQRMRAGLAR